MNALRSLAALLALFSIAMAEKPPFTFKGKACLIESMDAGGARVTPEEGYQFLKIQGRLVPDTSLWETYTFLKPRDIDLVCEKGRVSSLRNDAPYNAVIQIKPPPQTEGDIRSDLLIDRTYRVTSDWKNAKLTLKFDAYKKERGRDEESVSIPLPPLSPPNSINGTLHPKVKVRSSSLVEQLQAEEKVSGVPLAPPTYRPAHGRFLKIIIEPVASQIMVDTLSVRTKSATHPARLVNDGDGPEPVINHRVISKEETPMEVFFVVPAATTRCILEAGGHQIPLILGSP